MNITLPLDSMTTAEKIRAMEALWEDLSRNSDELPSPAWHGDVLTERDSRVAEGREQVHQWSTAKEEIRRACDGD